MSTILITLITTTRSAVLFQHYHQLSERSILWRKKQQKLVIIGQQATNSTVYLRHALCREPLKKPRICWSSIEHYNSSVWFATQLFTALIMCVLILYTSIQFIVDSEQQIFEKLFMVILFFSLSFCQKSSERMQQKKYFFIFRFVL